MLKKDLIKINKELEDKIEKIANERDELKKILMNVGDGVISFDLEGRVLFMNPKVEELTGIDRGVGETLLFDSLVKHKFEFNEKEFTQIFDDLKKGSDKYKEPSKVKLMRNDNKEFIISFTASNFKDSKGNIDGFVMVFRDVSKEVERLNEIEYLSYHDPLTGLYNRHYLKKALRDFDDKKFLPLSIMIVDINGLKLTNDAFGHKVGDALIKTTADILTKEADEKAKIFRVGGDEFAIIIPNCDKAEARKFKDGIVMRSKKVDIESGIISLAIGFSIREYMSQSISSIFKEADNQMYRFKTKSGKLMRSQTIETVLRSINNKYDQEQIHTERVSTFCELIARNLSLKEKDAERAKQAGILHDIGKIAISPEILQKKGRLTDEEFEIVKKHTNLGYQILKSVDEYADLAEAVLYHHEWFDGSGYPEGLKGEEIPLLSRIISVADAYEAMTTDRPYQKSKSKEDAILELKKFTNTQFDPLIVNAFIEVILKEYCYID